MISQERLDELLKAEAANVALRGERLKAGDEFDALHTKLLDTQRENDALRGERDALVAAVRGCAETELGEMACTGSMAPCENALGVLFAAAGLPQAEHQPEALRARLEAQPVGYVAPEMLRWLNNPARHAVATVELRIYRSPFDGVVPIYFAPPALTNPQPEESAQGGAKDAGRYRKLQKVTPYLFKKLQDAAAIDAGDVFYLNTEKFDAALDALSTKDTSP